nr:DUF4381 domain-containing protein [Marinifaba aquimaris]
MAAFNDYVLPEQVSQLPAIGWWLIGVLALIIIGLASVYSYRYWQKQKPRRQALSQITSIKTAIEVNTLFKQASLSYLPRNQVAQLNGEKWLAFQLSVIPSSLADKLRPSLTLINEKTYQANNQLDSQLIKDAETWLKKAQFNRLLGANDV